MFTLLIVYIYYINTTILIWFCIIAINCTIQIYTRKIYPILNMSLKEKLYCQIWAMPRK